MAGKRAVRRGPLPPPDWRFNSFPTYFALATGMLSGLLIGGSQVDPVRFVAAILALFGFTFGIVHIVTRTFLANRQSRAAARADDDERDRREYAARAAAAAGAPVAPPRRKRKRR